MNRRFYKNISIFCLTLESANVILTTYPQIRCHTQPTGNVFVTLGCGKKKMVSHEDFRRPQCPKFFSKYNFTLKEGEFDEDMVEYWLKKVSPK